MTVDVGCCAVGVACVHRTT